MEISHATHHHKLVLKHATRPYYCGGCDQLGFGLSYLCNRNGCNFFLHKECGRPITQIKYPFSQSQVCVMKFRDGGSGVGSACDACGKTIKRLHYRCTCSFIKRNVHPSCLAYEKRLEAALGLTLQLEKESATNCLHCHKINISSKVHGWTYVSSCRAYCYHVSCVKEIINKNWSSGFFNDKSDPFLTIKERFPEDMDRMHQLVVAQREGRNRKRAEAVLSVIFNVITGNPFGLVGAAHSYFSK